MLIVKIITYRRVIGEKQLQHATDKSFKPQFINNMLFPYANTAKFFGVALDAKLRTKEYLKKKTDELNIKFIIGCLAENHESV